MSIAALARLSRWGKGAPFTDYLAGAKKGFAHVSEKGPSYCDDGKENIIDDYTALLAATELFAATNDETYLTAARTRASALHQRLSSTGYFIADAGTRPYWHASDAGLPIVALATYAGAETDEAKRSEAIDTIRTHLAYLVKVTGEAPNPFGYARQHVSATKSGFFIPHVNESNYWWQGENARLGSLAAAALIGGRILGDKDVGWVGVNPALAAYATDQLDWVLGKNPFDVSFVDGLGRNNPPPYPGGKPQGGHLRGGIVNGVTGLSEDGSGIQWVAEGSGENWRWNEQWIPHAAWYLVAITAFAQSAVTE